MRYRRLLFALCLLTQFLALPFLARATPLTRPLAETFPPEKFNGLQVTYSVSGVELGVPEDKPGFTWVRTYKGRLTGDRLIVSGIAHAEGGWSAELSVEVSATGAKPGTHKAKKAPEHGLAPDPMDERFSVGIDIPRNATSAQFTISLTGNYNAGSRGVMITGTFSRELPTPTPTPTPGAPRLEAQADPLFLPADGASQSRVTFTYREGERPVGGKTITVALSPAVGTLDRSSVTTNSDGEAVVVVTAPQSGDPSTQRVLVRGQGPGVSAEVGIDIGLLHIADLGIYSRAAAGGDQVALEALVRSYHTAELKQVAVDLYDGDPRAGGKRLGEQIIPSIPANGQAWSGGAPGQRSLVDWKLGLTAEKRTLYVQVLVTAWSSKPSAERSFTVSNYGTAFKANVDGYRFGNPGTYEGEAYWLEDALATFLAKESLSTGLQVLSYPTLLQEVVQFEKNFGAGHCEGMANSANSYFVQPGGKPAPGPVYDYAESDPAVRGNIVLHQFYQFSSSFESRLPAQGRFDPDPARLSDLRQALLKQLRGGKPVTIAMAQPNYGTPGVPDNGAHAVLAYQAVEVAELGLSRLMLYDPNLPYARLSDGLAPAATLVVGQQAFSYNNGSPYDKIRLEWTPNLPANAGRLLVEMARDLAQATFQELLGTTPPSRLVTFRGSVDPVLVTADGKRLGIVNGKQVNEIPGASMMRYFGAYVFRLPGNIAVNANARVRANGTISIGAATPKAKTGRAPGVASPDAQAAGELAVVRFAQVPVNEGAELALVLGPEQVKLTIGGKDVAPTGQDTLSLASFGGTQPSPAAPVGPQASPVWRDPLDGKADSGAASFTGPRTTSPVAPLRGVAWEPGSAGQAAKLVGDESYIGYTGSRLNAQQGTILFRYKPAPDLAGLYAKRHAGWTDYGANPPPASGFLLDTIGWNAAPKGSFGLTLNPAPGGSLIFGVWDGSQWHNVIWKMPTGWQWDSARWYEIGVSWGPKGMAILVDGEQKAALPDVVQVNTTQPWFLGQGPWYWPYGPHTLVGSYDEVRVYNVQVGAYAAQTPTPVPPRPGGQAAQPRRLTFLGGAPLAGAQGGRLPNAPASGPANPGAAAAATARPAAGQPRATATPSSPGGETSGVATPPGPLTPGDLERVLPGGLDGSLAQALRGLPGGERLYCLAAVLCCLLPLILTIVILFLVLRRRPARGLPTSNAAPTSAAPPPPREGVPENQRAGALAPTSAAPPPPPPEVWLPGSAGNHFCDQCGARLLPGTRFCGQCGAPVRRGVQ